MKRWNAAISLTLTLSLFFTVSITAYAEEEIGKDTANTVVNIEKSKEDSKQLLDAISQDKNLVTSIEVLSTNVNFDADDNLKKLGSISVKKVLLINGEENPLFCTFDDPEEAMTNLKNEIPDFLTDLSEKYSLPELNDDSWEEYRSSLVQEKDEVNEISSEMALLSSFFDIYENESVNNDILDNLSENQSKRQIDNSNMEDLIFKLPYTSPILSKYHSDKDSKIQPRSFNRSMAVEYAEQYAEDPNPFYQYFGRNGDCTNFMSQILEYAGIRQNAYWWHETNGSLHNNSVSWSVANEFADYWGIDYTTTSFGTLTRKVTQADIIAYDETGDGSWNHLAFISDVDSDNGGDYRDVRIAQHSKDYVDWVSGTTNGWETLKDSYPKMEFGIIYWRYLS